MSNNLKTEKLLALNLPLVNFLLNISVSLSSIRGGAAAILKASLLIYLIVLVIFVRKKLIISKIESLIFGFSIYISALLFFASDLDFSSYQVLKVVIVLNSYTVFKYYITSINDFNKLLKSFYTVMVLQIISIIIGQFFKIGASEYLEDSFYGGIFGLPAFEHQAFLILIALALLSTKYGLHKLILVLAIIFSVIFILVYMRRTAILTLAAGVLVYLYFNRYSFIRFMKMSTLLLLIGIVFVFFFFETFMIRYNTRMDVMDQWYGSPTFINKEEGRFQDPIRGFMKMSDSGVMTILFGGEVFNSQLFMKSYRELHNGYAAIMTGTGFIGLCFFLYILYCIMKDIWTVSSNKIFYSVHMNIQIQEIDGIIILGKVFFLMFLVYLFPSRLHSMNVPLSVFMIFGAFSGLFINIKKALINEGIFSTGNRINGQRYI